MTLILRSRTATFKFKVADGVSVDPAGNVLIKEAIKATDKDGKETQEMQLIAAISPADFLHLYHDDSVEMEPIEVTKPA